MGGLNPAHVPYWRENNPTLWDFCISMIGRADIEGSLLWTFGCHKPVIPPPTNLGICRPLHSAWPSKGIQCLPRNNVAHRHADLKTDASVCIQGMIGRALIGFSRFRSIFVGRTCFQWQRNLMRSIYVCLKGFSIVVSKSYCAFFTFPSLPTHRCRQPLQLLSSGWKQPSALCTGKGAGQQSHNEQSLQASVHQQRLCCVPSLTKACGPILLLTQDFQELVPAQPAQLIVGWLDQFLPLQHDLAHQAKNLDLSRKKRTRRCLSWTSHCCHPTLRSARHPSKSLQLHLSSLPSW